MAAKINQRWTPTHRHAEGGTYRLEGYCQVKLMEGGEWTQGVIYTDELGRKFATSIHRWHARFKELDYGGNR